MVNGEHKYLGQDFPCEQCGKTVERVAYSHKFCPDCAADRNRESYRRRQAQRREDSKNHRVEWPKPERPPEKEVVGHSLRCSFCGRLPTPDNIVATEKTGNIRWWRCICRPAESQLYQKAIVI